MKKAKPNPDFFRHALSALNLKPEEVVHVGDEIENDFHCPGKVGIKAFVIDRKDQIKAAHAILDLREIIKKIE